MIAVSTLQDGLSSGVEKDKAIGKGTMEVKPFSKSPKC